IELAAEDRPARPSRAKRASSDGPADRSPHGERGADRRRKEPSFEPVVIPAADSLAEERRRRQPEGAGRAEGRRPTTKRGDSNVSKAGEKSGGTSSSGGDTRKGGGKRKRRWRKGAIVGRVLYWGLVLSLWAAVGLAALIGYHFAQLPPIDQLAV